MLWCGVIEQCSTRNGHAAQNFSIVQFKKAAQHKNLVYHVHSTNAVVHSQCKIKNNMKKQTNIPFKIPYLDYCDTCYSK